MSTAIFAKDTVTGSNDAVAISSNNLHVAQYVWDTATLSWIRQTQSAGGGGGGGDVNVVATVGLTNTQLRAAPIDVKTGDYAERVDDLGTTLYVGKASLGVDDSSSAWSIKRVQFVGNEIVTKWANGSNSFINSWSSRASYTYS